MEKNESVELTILRENRGIEFTIHAVSFVGARVEDNWYCCSCLDIFFTPQVADQLMEQQEVGDLRAVYSNGVWVQHQVCYGCQCRYDEEP